MIQKVTEDDGIERPDEPWKYPYVAAATDWGSSIRILVRSDDSYAMGYQIRPDLRFHHSDRGVLGFLDEFCENHGLRPRRRETDTGYRLEISKRDDIDHFLRLVRPYLIARMEVADLLLDDLIPMLDEGIQSDEDGFLRIMDVVDQIRDHTHGTGQRKYDKDYFLDEFGRSS
jgi:hypothetical protein